MIWVVWIGGTITSIVWQFSRIPRGCVPLSLWSFYKKNFISSLNLSSYSLKKSNFSHLYRKDSINHSWSHLTGNKDFFPLKDIVFPFSRHKLPCSQWRVTALVSKIWCSPDEGWLKILASFCPKFLLNWQTLILRAFWDFVLANLPSFYPSISAKIFQECPFYGLFQTSSFLN